MAGRRGFVTSERIALASLGLVLAASPATAQQGVFMRDTLSTIGLIEPEKPVINYQERAPLAMPPSLTRPGLAKPGPAKPGRGGPAGVAANGALALPPPQARQSDPAWPKDPEISRRERAAIEAQKPITRGAQGRVSDNNETLSVYEMDRGYKAGAGIPTSPEYRPGDGNREATWLNPLQMLTGTRETAAPSAVEPARGSLTEPPTGYRRAPVQAVAPAAAPLGGSISGNEEADPRAFLRSQGR